MLCEKPECWLFPTQSFVVLLFCEFISFKLINKYTSRVSNWVGHEKGAEMCCLVRQTKGNTNAEWLHTVNTAESCVGSGRAKEPGDCSGKQRQ